MDQRTEIIIRQHLLCARSMVDAGAPVLCLNAPLVQLAQSWYPVHFGGLICIHIWRNNETIKPESHQEGWQDLEIILTIHG